MCILRNSVPWTVFTCEIICSGAASSHLCSHFNRIRSGPTNKLLDYCWGIYWDSVVYVMK